MSRLSSLALPFCVALSIVVLLFLSFPSSSSAAAFTPHTNIQPPVYNFASYRANRVWVNNTYIYVGPQYVTPNILWGLGVGFVMLIILYVALSCLMSIQRPVRMSSVQLVLSKEY